MGGEGNGREGSLPEPPRRNVLIGGVHNASSLPDQVGQADMTDGFLGNLTPAHVGLYRSQPTP